MRNNSKEVSLYDLSKVCKQHIRGSMEGVEGDSRGENGVTRPGRGGYGREGVDAAPQRVPLVAQLLKTVKVI